MFEGIDDATLRSWLKEAQSALHDIETGKRVVMLVHNGKRIEYQRSNLQSLRAYISQLSSAVSGNGRARATGIGVIF